MIRFGDTVLFEQPGHLMLLDLRGQVLLEIAGPEYDEALRTGFLDAGDLHGSLYALWRMREHPGERAPELEEPSEVVARLLESLSPHPPEDGSRHTA